MLVCTAGIGEAVWPGFKGLVGDNRGTVRASWQVWTAIYIGAATAACLAAAGFDVRLAVRRLPVVLLLASAAVALFLLVWIAGHIVAAAGDESSTGGTSNGAGEDDTVSPNQPRENLATALLGPADAELGLGAPVGPPSTRETWLSRSASICSYRTLENSASLTLIVYGAVSRWFAQRLLQRGSPVAGIGETASDDGHRLCVGSGEYLLMLSAWRRDRQRTDRRPIIAVARRVTDRLPTGPELDAVDRALFASGWRSRLNALFATIGLPVR
jgi:hypothetical protein